MQLRRLVYCGSGILILAAIVASTSFAFPDPAWVIVAPTDGEDVGSTSSGIEVSGSGPLGQTAKIRFKVGGTVYGAAVNVTAQGPPSVPSGLFSATLAAPSGGWPSGGGTIELYKPGPPEVILDTVNVVF